MSTAKRSRRRQPEANSASPLPASKRQKTTATSHVPTESGLGFLVDEDARAGRRLEARFTNGVPASKANRVDESHALVAPDTKDEDDEADVSGKQHEVIDISSGEDESSEYEEDDEAGEHPEVNGHAAGVAEGEDAQLGAEDETMEDLQEAHEDGDEDVDAQEPAEPSFGDLLRARHPDPVNVHESLQRPGEERTAMVSTGSRALTVPSATSLTTVLTQALKTNDKDLLETCFQNNRLPDVRATIERLQSQHAAALLQRLAERIHRSPGRTGNLMIWIQWTLVTHGGYISSQPETMRRLKSLAQVVRERASGLQPLLHLKGKLDLLSAQLEYRKNMQTASRSANAEDEDDEEAVVYVEGQADDWSEDEDNATQTDTRMLEPPASKPRGQTATPKTDVSDSEDDDSDEELPNSVVQEGDDESADEEEEQEDERLVDDEAEETSDDEDEELSSDEEADSTPEDDEESEPSEDESEPEIKQSQPKTLNRKR